jgi:hypothetical protein
MRSPGFIRHFRTAAILAVLVLAQSAVAAHLDFDDSHAAGESCALCAGQSVLGAGNVAASVPVEAVVRSLPAVDHRPGHEIDRRVERRFARGPPIAS